jgi:hypothetical protein
MINDKEKTFVTGFVKARTFREMLSISKRMDLNDLSAEELDELVQLTCQVFDFQFSVDEFYDGLPTEEIVPTIVQVFQTINGTTNGEKTEKK